MWIQLVGQKVQKFQFEEFWSIMISYFLKSYQFKFYGLKTSIQTISRFFNHKLRIFTNFSTNQIDFSWKKHKINQQDSFWFISWYSKCEIGNSWNHVMSNSFVPSWKNKLKEEQKITSRKKPGKAKRKQNPNSKRLWFLSTTFSFGQQPKRAQNT